VAGAVVTTFSVDFSVPSIDIDSEAVAEMAAAEPVEPMPQSQRPILAAVVDLDGTLIDTEPLYFESYAALTHKHGHTNYNFVDHHSHILGRQEHKGAQILIDLLKLPLTPDELLKERDVIFLEKVRHVSLLPGALDAMKKLKAAGLKLAIATSSCREYLPAKSEAHPELFSLFDAVICGDDEGCKGHSKPDPHIFLHAAEVLGVAPENCVCFEDSIAGMAAGRNAGMWTIGIPDSRLTEKQVVEEGRPHIAIKSFEEFDLEKHLRVQDKGNEEHA
jgi:pseudouridine 5'-phosphatase